MKEFDFVTDAQSEAFCRAIVAEIERLFGMSHAEALKAVNRHWGGRNLVFTGEDDIIYHEDETFWAKTMVLGKYWWKDGE